MKKIAYLHVLFYISIVFVLSACSKKSIDNVTLSLDGYEKLLSDGNKSLDVESVYGHKYYEEEYYTFSSCLTNVTIVSGNKNFLEGEMEHYSHPNENDIVVEPYHNTNIIVLSSKGDTLLRYISTGYSSDDETEIITYAKLYKDFSNKQSNHIITRMNGTLHFETPECVYYLYPETKIEYEALNGESQVYCKKETETDIGKDVETWFYPNGVKKEYKESSYGKVKVHKYYDEAGNEVRKSSRSNQSAPNSFRQESEEIIFRSASDVMNYLSGVSFTDGEFTLIFKYDGLYANGRLLTGAIVVEDYDEVGAILSCYSPYSGSRIKFKLVSEMLVKNLNTGEIYYINK